MSNDDKIRPGDADIRRAWRQVSDESPPPNLDRSVMRAARRPRARLERWTRPLALVATVLVGVLLLFDTQSPLRGPEPAREEAPAATTPNAAPASRAAPAASADPERRRKTAGKVAAPSVAEDFAQPQRARQEATSDAERDGLRPEAAEMSAPAARAVGTSAEPASRTCKAEQRKTADRWWQCIEDLAAAGNEAGANAEKQRLQAAFPGFTVPE